LFPRRKYFDRERQAKAFVKNQSNNFLNSTQAMGKKRPAAGERGDAPKRFKEGTKHNGPQEKKNFHRNADGYVKKQKTVLVSATF
jgi:hypothetical protein